MVQLCNFLLKKKKPKNKNVNGSTIFFKKKFYKINMNVELKIIIIIITT